MTILDSVDGMSIATKLVWERWGKLALRKTWMSLQSADGSLNNLIGVVEDITVESCGIEYEHTFSIVDFQVNTIYKVILGQTFKLQLKKLQDWGFNYLYLRQETSITRFNLKNHSYRNVTALPVK